jgi:ferrous iron transport protein B
MTTATVQNPSSKLAGAAKKTITIAVAGNPNSGKSTLINAIAGSRLQVGNWPGVTVEKKSAEMEFDGKKIKLVDLPGCYSLSPYSQEEIVARDFLVFEKPDVVINVVDTTNLERNLYLTVQIMELGAPVVVALNMFDEAEQKGYKVDVTLLVNALGAACVPTVATKGAGLLELLRVVVNLAQIGSAAAKPAHYGQDFEMAAQQVIGRLKTAHPALLEKFPARWLAFKILEQDADALAKAHIVDAAEIIGQSASHLLKAHDDTIESLMADARYAVCAGLAREAMTKPLINRRDLTEKIDRVMLDRYFGIPIFLAAMWLMFKLTFDLSAPFVDWIDGAMQDVLKPWAAAVFTAVGSSDWLVSLVRNGVIGGMGFVLVFVPVIFAMMFFITFLEGSGYMARAAFVMDRAMHSMGLHGKSFIPMLMGFGCNVPAIYATRTLESERDRILTSLLLPLMSCGARLPVYVLFVAAFFTAHQGLVLWSLYVMGIALAVMMGIIFRKTLFRHDAPVFIMELPPYRMPTLNNLLIHTWEKGKHFLIKAGTYILAMSILVWFGLNLPWGVNEKKDSVIGMAGQVIAPVLSPLGFGNWEAASSLITGVIAKEVIVGTMGEIYSGGGKDKEKPALPIGEGLGKIGSSFGDAIVKAASNVFSTFNVSSIAQKTEAGEDTSALRERIKGAFTPLSAYSFMAFVLIYMPCMITAVAYRQEFGAWKWFFVAAGYGLVLGWLVSFAIYQGGHLMGFE